MSDATGPCTAEARRILVAALEAARQPMSPARLIRLLREHGVDTNPGGVLIGLLADGGLIMGEDRLLRLAPEPMVA